MNSNLSSGIVPLNFKYAVVQTLIKNLIPPMRPYLVDSLSVPFLDQSYTPFRCSH